MLPPTNLAKPWKRVPPPRELGHPHFQHYGDRSVVRPVELGPLYLCNAGSRTGHFPLADIALKAGMGPSAEDPPIRADL